LPRAITRPQYLPAAIGTYLGVLPRHTIRGGGGSHKLYGLPRFPTHVGREKSNNFGKSGLTRTGERRARIEARR
jgi:hypothetical protein